MIPDDLKYSKEHEWVRLDKDMAVVGITDYAQNELGDVVFIELPKVGAQLKFMEPFGTIEAVKAVADLFSPVTGQVTEVNVALENDAGIVNADPYGDGWIVKVKVENLSELNNLLDAKAYQDLIGQKS